MNVATLQNINMTGVSFTGGTGYFAPPVVAILPATNGTQSGGGAGASGYATIDASGNLTGIVITNPGVGYTTVTSGTNTYYPTAVLLGGGGSGATIGALTLGSVVSGGGLTQNGTGTITYSSPYSTFTGPVALNGGTMIVFGHVRRRRRGDGGQRGGVEHYRQCSRHHHR